MKSARQTAVEALLRVDRGGYSQLTLDSVLLKEKLSPKEAAFAAALFYGVIERRLTLDYCISGYARHPLSDTVAEILRAAIYQLLYLDGVPGHAAVDEAVEMSKRMGQRAAANMINGILRSFIRAGCVVPKVKGTLSQQLAVEYSCSQELCELFVKWFGEEKAREILVSAFGRPPIFIRVNTIKTDVAALLAELPDEIKTEKPPLLDGNCIEVTGNIAHSHIHRAGLLHIQDYCSQQAALTVGAKENERILDICAAPGSKSFVMAQQMKNKGGIIACDISTPRLELIKEGAARLGITIIETKTNDGTVYDAGLGEFDRVLCDVPCSGLGVLRRKPEIKYRGKADIEALPQLQYKILETSAKYLKKGGVLVYSTCTINPEENEKIAERFLAENKGFCPMPFDGDAWYKTNLPSESGGDGFFISRIRRIK